MSRRDSYTDALREIYRLRTALAYEAHVLSKHLELATFPKSRRVSARAQVMRMQQCALGDSVVAYDDVEEYWLDLARDGLGLPPVRRELLGS